MTARNAAAVALLWAGPQRFHSAAEAGKPFGVTQATVERLSAAATGEKKEGSLHPLRPQLTGAAAAAAEPEPMQLQPLQPAQQPQQQQQKKQQALWPIFNIAKKQKS